MFSLTATGKHAITRLAVTEAPIDALSLATIEGLQPGTLYAATRGGMGAGTVAAIQDMLAGMSTRGSGELVSATNADPTGAAYTERHAYLARGAGITFLRLRPTSGTDWNNVLKGQGA